MTHEAMLVFGVGRPGIMELSDIPQVKRPDSGSRFVVLLHDTNTCTRWTVSAVNLQLSGKMRRCMQYTPLTFLMLLSRGPR
jgi:hypothetical protein